MTFQLFCISCISRILVHVHNAEVHVNGNCSIQPHSGEELDVGAALESSGKREKMQNLLSEKWVLHRGLI